MVSALVPWSSGPGLSPGQGHSVVFLGKTLNSHGASLHQVYKWVPVNCWGNLTNYGGVTCDGLASRLGGIEILLAASCYRDRDKLRQLWASTGSKASLYVLNLKVLGQSETWLKEAKISQRACVFEHCVADKIWAGDLYGRLQWRADWRAIALFRAMLKQKILHV